MSIQLGIYLVTLEIKKGTGMIYGIPLFRERVAPRCTIADSILLVKATSDGIDLKERFRIEEKSWIELLKILNDNKVDTLVCGGINFEHRKSVLESDISIIDNVACSGEDIIKAIEDKTLRPGFGFSINLDKYSESMDKNINDENDWLAKNIDCLSCKDRFCLEGKICNLASRLNSYEKKNKEIKQILNSAMDISLEEERKLCRFSELIYFALEMDYKRIGVAYCTDLSEPAEIFTQVMRRFFEVFPVCCKVGGKRLSESIYIGNKKIACNPLGQAEILNKIGVDFNVIIGLCIGADCVFSKSSNAPVSTLFVKDKSLANNPIGALYSKYYLNEATNSSIT